MMDVQYFEVMVPQSTYRVEAVCITCGNDLVVVIGGGSRYHLGAVALSLCMPSIKDAQKLTNSTYQIPVPGHKEEALVREGSLLLSRELKKNVVMTAGLHEDALNKEGIERYIECFNGLVEKICQFYLLRI